ncbi:MAG: ATP-binding protein [Thermotogota bacterium]|nr:ATP-binding protein [Thermotogota bacterium]
MSVLLLVFLSFLFSIVFFIIFIITFQYYKKTLYANKKNTTFNAVKPHRREREVVIEEDPLEEQKKEIQQRLQTIRETEELLQGNLRDFEIETKRLNEEREAFEVSQQEIEDKQKALEKVRLILEKQKEEIDRMNIHKNEFMANMSHELKTPLNSILTLTQVLIKNKVDNLNEKQLKFLRTIYSSGKTLLSLINDVLDIAKIEAGKTETFIEPIEIGAIKNEISETFYAEQITKDVSFQIEIDENIPKIIYSDKKRLLQILRNILSNAFKFTEKGYIKFKILNHDSSLSKSTSMLSPENYIVFSIEDTGVGIADDKQKVIFDEFVQADGSTTRNYGGTGLGLAISQKLTTLLGGEIKLQSELGKGSTFNVYLPVSRKQKEKKYKQPLPKKINEPVSEKNLKDTLTEKDMKRLMKGKKIFMITKDMKYLFLFTNYMEGFKATVSGTNNPKEGLSKLQNNPDATFVVLDEYIAKDEDYKIMTEISSNQRLVNIPVVIIPQSNGTSDGLKEEFSDFGTTTVFPKEFDKTIIFNEISSLL